MPVCIKPFPPCYPDTLETSQHDESSGYFNSKIEELIESESNLDYAVQVSTLQPSLNISGLLQDVVAPGEIITEDPQWMRGHGTTQQADSQAIKSTLAGLLVRTNKLLSVTPLKVRYRPSIGDLVVGRVVQVQSKRWIVDIAAPLLALLPLAAINLPGGSLRKRTAVDELNMRGFFAEGDLVVAEVQNIYSHGAAVLHTRSLRFGKLRNGYFMSLSCVGGLAEQSKNIKSRSGGIIRSRRQIFTVKTCGSAEELEVYLGVNGYVWISQKLSVGSSDDSSCNVSGLTYQDVGYNKMEDMIGKELYSNQNTHINPATRCEIARVSSIISALIANGVGVDEDSVTYAYQYCVNELNLDVNMTGNQTDNSTDFGNLIYLSMEQGRLVAGAVLKHLEE